MYLKFEKTLWNWLLSSVLEKKNLAIGCLDLESLRDLAKAAVLIGVWELTLILQFLLPRCRRFDSAIIQTPSTFTLHLNVHNIERTQYFLLSDVILLSDVEEQTHVIYDNSLTSNKDL